MSMTTSTSMSKPLSGDSPAWPPDDGHCLDEERASAVIASHRHRIRQAVFDAYAAIDTSQPGVSAGHRLARPAELARCCRDRDREGCVVATVMRDGPGEDCRQATELLLTWDGDVRPASEEARERRVV